MAILQNSTCVGLQDIGLDPSQFESNLAEFVYDGLARFLAAR